MINGSFNQMRVLHVKVLNNFQRVSTCLWIFWLLWKNTFKGFNNVRKNKLVFISDLIDSSFSLLAEKPSVNSFNHRHLFFSVHSNQRLDKDLFILFIKHIRFKSQMCEHKIKCSSFNKLWIVFQTCNQGRVHQCMIVREIIFDCLQIYALLYRLDARGKHQRNFI